VAGFGSDTVPGRALRPGGYSAGQRDPVLAGKGTGTGSRLDPDRLYADAARPPLNGRRGVFVRSQRSISLLPSYTGRMPGAFCGNRANTDGSMLKCCVTNAGGVRTSHSESDTS
jgi:hypothetical protein